MGEVALVAGDADNGLRERLDQEISAFNAAATGYADSRLLCIAVHDDSGDLPRQPRPLDWGGRARQKLAPAYLSAATSCVRPLTWCQKAEVTAASRAAPRPACYAPGWTGVTFRKFGA